MTLCRDFGHTCLILMPLPWQDCPIKHSTPLEHCTARRIFICQDRRMFAKQRSAQGQGIALQTWFSPIFGRVFYGLQGRLRDLGLANQIPIQESFEPFGPGSDEINRARWPLSLPVPLGWMIFVFAHLRKMPCPWSARLVFALLCYWHLVDSLPWRQISRPARLKFFCPWGRHSHQIKKKYFGPNASGRMCILDEDTTHLAQVVSGYHHLGGLVHHKQDSVAEIRKRIAIAPTTFTQHRKTLLQNQCLSLRRRV